MALLRNIAGVGAALYDAQTADTDIRPTYEARVPTEVYDYYGDVSVVFDNPKPIPLPAYAVPVAEDVLPATTAEPGVAVSPATDKETDWLLLISLSAMYYTMIRGKGFVIKNPNVSLAGGLALLVYSLRKK